MGDFISLVDFLVFQD